MILGNDGDTRPYYYRLRGRALGPFGLQQMRQKALSAQVNGRTDVSRDGLDWGKASDFPEIFVQPEPSGTTTPESGEWYYLLGGAQQGPVDLAMLQQLVAGGSIKRDDVVFREGMADWVSVQLVPELVIFLPKEGNPDPRQGTGSGSNGLAIAGFVCALIPGVAVVGLILSLVALYSKNTEQRGFAVAGAIVGGLQTLGCLGCTGLWLLGVLNALSSMLV